MHQENQSRNEDTYNSIEGKEQAKNNDAHNLNSNSQGYSADVEGSYTVDNLFVFGDRL